MKLFFLSVASLATMLLHAQEFKGVAVYTSLTNFKDIKHTVKDEETSRGAALKDALSMPHESEYVLSFNKNESVFEQQVKLDPLKKSTARSSFGIGRQYSNLSEHSRMVEMEVLGKEFVVTDSLIKCEWTLEKETKQIGSYTCHKATCVIKLEPPTEEEKKRMEERGSGFLSRIPQSDIMVTAWYTPEIPVAHGPGLYWGLPGLILEVNNGTTMLLCSKVIFNPKESTEIKAPSKGTKVTQAEFTEIVSKKTKEMQEMYSNPDGSKAGTKRTSRN